MNSLSITGRIGKDAEVRHTQSGTAICSFSVAVNTGYGDNKKTLWFDVSIFGKRAESGLVQYLVKGQEVAVCGELDTFESDKGKTYLKLKAEQVDLIGGKPEGQSKPQQAPQQSNSFVDDFDDSSVPF